MQLFFQDSCSFSFTLLPMLQNLQEPSYLADLYSSAKLWLKLGEEIKMYEGSMYVQTDRSCFCSKLGRKKGLFSHLAYM